MNIAGVIKNYSRQLNDTAQRMFASAYIALLKKSYDIPTVLLTDIINDDPVIEDIIMDDMGMPPYIGKAAYDDHDDVTPLMKIVRLLQPQIVVELGTAFGNTTANICRQSPKSKIYTVNAPAEKQTGRFDTFKLTRNKIGRVYRSYGFQDRVVQIYENTLHLDLAQYFQKPVIYLAIIDACHNTRYVINDFLKVRPFMKPLGLVLLHDTYPELKMHLWGSYLACLKLRKKGFDIRHLHNTWWGVWRNITQQCNDKKTSNIHS